MANSLVGIILTLILAIVFGYGINPNIKDKVLPWVFAFVLWSDATGRFFMFSTVVYYFTFILTFIGYAFLLSNLRLRELHQNEVWACFFVFIAWYALAAVWGDMVSLAEKTILVQMRIVLCGFAVGSWALRAPGNMEKLMRFAVLAVAISALQFSKYGSWSVADFAQAGGRHVLDSELDVGGTNVNVISLVATAIIVYPSLYLMHRWNYKSEKIVKIVAFAAICVLGLVTIKTGSRNGGLALLALATYFVTGRTNMKKAHKILVLVAVSAIALFAIVRFVGDVEMRSFLFVSQEEKERGAYGSGRLDFYISIYNQMTPEQRIIGAGAPVELLPTMGIWHIANRHSMYMQVFNQAGYVGVFFMLLFFIRICLLARKGGSVGAMGLLLFGVWALTGVGEAANMIAGLANYDLGVAIALCGAARRYNMQMLQWQWHGWEIQAS